MLTEQLGGLMATTFGKFRGVVLDAADPNDTARLQVDVPDAGVHGVWAAACLPPVPLGLVQLPETGDTVWVEFEGGDPDKPVWTGVGWPSGALAPTAGTLTLEATTLVTLRAPQVKLESALVAADGLVSCGTLTALNGVISPSYTPGAGNIS